jgi:predicted  nucleic acid-binding Zn-ribbon protein
MNEQHPLQSFIDLVTFDQELVALENEVKKLEHEGADATSKIFQIEQTVEQAKKRLAQARKQVDEKELEMKELEAQRVAGKERLDLVQNAKEYQAIKAEVEKLKQMQSSLDESLLSAWNSFELLQKEVDALIKDSEKKLTDTWELQEKKKAKIQELTATMQERTVMRKEKEKGVSADWLERYAMMRSRVTDPVVSVLNHSCSACFWSISQQDMLTLKRGTLLQCKGCYRFLYVPQEEPEKLEK